MTTSTFFLHKTVAILFLFRKNRTFSQFPLIVFAVSRNTHHHKLRQGQEHFRRCDFSAAKCFLKTWRINRILLQLFNHVFYLLPHFNRIRDGSDRKKVKIKHASVPHKCIGPGKIHHRGRISGAEFIPNSMTYRMTMMRECGTLLMAGPATDAVVF